MKKVLFEVAFFSMFFLSLYLILTKVDIDKIDGQVVSVFDFANNQMSSRFEVMGVGMSEFVSRPLSEGAFTPNIEFYNEDEEAVFMGLAKALSTEPNLKYVKFDLYKQEVVFDGFLAVLNKGTLAKIANIHNCGAYEIKSIDYILGIRIIYDCTPEM